LASLLQGILEAVDRDICDFFVDDPAAMFVSQSMSSFERLLAHACSIYYQLKSYSKLTKTAETDVVILKIFSPKKWRFLLKLLLVFGKI
jgi:hypothetical protein